MRARGCRVKPVGEILRFVGHQSFAEFHDAHRVRWYAVIGKYEFSDPEIAAADYSPDRKTLLVWLDRFGTTEFIVLYAILKRGALLPIAPVVCRLTMRAIAVWSKDTPVASPRQCTGSHATSAAMPRSRPARYQRSDRTGVRCRSTAESWSRECLFFGGCQPQRRSGSCLRAGWQATRCRPGSPPA